MYKISASMKVQSQNDLKLNKLELLKKGNCPENFKVLLFQFNLASEITYFVEFQSQNRSRS